MPAPRTRGSHAGVVFTPPALAARLAEFVPAEAAVLDPACGDGALLAALGARELHGIEVDEDFAARARTRLTHARIACADALSDNALWPRGTWIIANPPWLSFSGRHAGKERVRVPRASGGWPALHSAFTARIAEHVASEGTGAEVLLPAALVESERYGPLREVVSALVHIAATEELGEDAFPGVTEPAVRLSLRPGGQRGSQRPWLQTNPADAWLIDALARHPRLPAGSFADPGVHSGNAASELVLPADASGAPALRQGRDLAPYRLGAASARLNMDLEPNATRRFRVASLERYQSFPVLLRQTADRPIAALHAEPSYFRNSLLACRDVPGLDPAVIVTVLNSSIATEWHRAMFRDARQRSFPQVKVRHLAGQPFPFAHRDAAPRLHDELARRSRALCQGGERSAEEAQALEQRVLEAFALPPR
jgi:hypothetical protein